MRAFLLVSLFFVFGCSQSPQGQPAAKIRSDADNQAQSIIARADAQAKPLDAQADALQNEAKQAGGYTAKRLNVQADALRKQGKLLREQADEQGDAIKEAADARVKALESR